MRGVRDDGDAVSSARSGDEADGTAMRLRGADPAEEAFVRLLRPPVYGSVSAFLKPAMTHATTVTVQVPPPLRACCAGASALSVPAASVRGLLDELERSHPSLHRSICDETG